MPERHSNSKSQLRPCQRKFQDLTGRRFSHWLVLEFAGMLPKRRISVWWCRCACGRTLKVARTQLISAHSKSCGCFSRVAFVRHSTKHGMSSTRVFGIWNNMRRRCYNPRRTGYADYGGRGIIVCKRWHEFKNFFADMGHPPTPEHSLDRLDSDGNYEPSNCRWATPKEQARNKRNNHNLTINGQTRTMSEWSEITGADQSQILRRIKRGWPVEEAVGLKEHVSRQGQRPWRTGYKSDYKPISRC